MIRSRLKSFVKRALDRDEAPVVRAPPPPPRTSAPPTTPPSAPSAPQTSFAGLASAAAMGTLDEALDAPVVLALVNESSASRQAGRVLTIDQHECISCGTCVENSEPVFHLPSEGPDGEEAKAEVLRQEGHWGEIQDAIDACPVMCIAWIDPAEVAPHHSAGGHVDDGGGPPQE